VRLSAFIMALSFSLPVAALASPINVKPSDNIAQIVAAAPAGSSFLFSPGTYRMLQVKPKTGDSFSGPGTGTALLDGSEAVTFSAAADSSGLWEATIGAMPLDSGRCDSLHPLCHYTRELFVGSKLLMPVSSVDQLTSSTWFYNATTGTATLSFNPGAGKAYMGTAICAFCSLANDVTVNKFIVQRYASPSQSGAIGYIVGGTHWVVTNVEGRYNHGGAVQVGANSTVEGCYLHNNGQKGLGGSGANLVIENNQLSYNNYDGFDGGWEAGGAKFGHLDSAEIINNYVHNNVGSGLWDDVGGIYVHYKGNRVINNTGSGIQHEVGYNAIIEDNIVNLNGTAPRISLWDGQISVQNSSHTVVQNNSIVVAADYGSGLVIINQDRGDAVGAYNTIVNNEITFQGTSGANGIMGTASTGVGNEINYNTYHITVGLDRHHWEAFGIKSFPQFQDAGFDQDGKIIWVAAKN
jgi:hypothetical protein